MKNMYEAKQPRLKNPSGGFTDRVKAELLSPKLHHVCHVFYFVGLCAY